MNILGSKSFVGNLPGLNLENISARKRDTSHVHVVRLVYKILFCFYFIVPTGIHYHLLHILTMKSVLSLDEAG